MARRPRTVLLVVTLLTAAAAWTASGLGFDSSYFALLPEDAPAVRQANRVRELTGGHRQLVLVIDGADAPTRERFGRILAHRLEAHETVRWADAQLPSDDFEERLLWLIDDATMARLVPAVREAVHRVAARHGPFALHLDDEVDDLRTRAAWKEVGAILGSAGDLPGPTLTSRDGQTSLVVITPTVRVMDMAGSRALFAAVDAAVESTRDELGAPAQGLRVRSAGKFTLVREQHQVLTHDLGRASLLALLGCIVVIIGISRRLAGPLVVGVAVAIGLTWTLAVARLLLGSLNVLSGMLLAVLVGLGVDFGIHLLIRFEQDRRFERRPPLEAAERAVAGLLRPSAVAAVTTAGAFGVLCLSDFRGFSELGLVAAIGVLLTLASAFLVVPCALVVLSDRRAASRPEGRAEPGETTGQTQSGAPYCERHRIPPAQLSLALTILAIGSAGAIYGAAAIDDIPFHNDYRLLRTESDGSAFFEWVDSQVGLRFDPTVLVAPSLDEARRVHRVIDALCHEGGRCLVDEVFSAARLVPRPDPWRTERATRLADLADVLSARFLDRAGSWAQAVGRLRLMTTAEPWALEDLPDVLRRRLTTLDGEGIVVLLWGTERIESDTQALAWAAQIDRLRSRLDGAGVNTLVSGETVMPAWVHQHIRADGPRLIALAALVVFLIAWVDLRSLRRTLLLFVPLAAGLLWTLGTMRATGMELNMFNLVVLPCALGIGIDDVVHIGHRVFQRGCGSVGWVLRRTGVAVLLTSLTTAIGFGAMMTSSHLGLFSVGVLALLAITSALVAATVFLPALLVVFQSLVEGAHPKRQTADAEQHAALIRPVEDQVP